MSNKCVHGDKMHARFRGYGKHFVEFWHGYFRSTGRHIRDLPIKNFLSAIDLVNVRDLWSCSCDDLIEKIFAFDCPDCHKYFSTKRTLQNHRCSKKVRTKNTDEPFECCFCEKSFSNKDKLLRHTIVHTAEHYCDVCQQSLHQYDLERHAKTKKHLNNLSKKAGKKSKK